MRLLKLDSSIILSVLRADPICRIPWNADLGGIETAGASRTLNPAEMTLPCCGLLLMEIQFLLIQFRFDCRASGLWEPSIPHTRARACAYSLSAESVEIFASHIRHSSYKYILITASRIGHCSDPSYYFSSHDLPPGYQQQIWKFSNQLGRSSKNN